MATYLPPDPSNWTGRNSGRKHYLHEQVELVSMETPIAGAAPGTLALLGYCCDEGVRRNQGRPGAASGPSAIRRQLGGMPNHLPAGQHIWDVGDVSCPDGDMEEAQRLLADKVSELRNKELFPVLLGGGHDIAYGHYRGIRNTLDSSVRLGIVNLDAHLDLREPVEHGHSGTPFNQIALDAAREGFDFRYLCMGVRSDANHRDLFKRAQELKTALVPRQAFVPWRRKAVRKQLQAFLEETDLVYLTIDLDGFSSAFAPGVSAASPLGFAPEMAWEVMRVLVASGKLCAMDIAEMNPDFDRDGQTAKLAASLVHRLTHSAGLL